MTIRDDVQPSAPPQHFDITATPAATTSGPSAPLEDPEIAVGPTAYATAIIHDDHAHVPIIQATTLPIGGASGGGGPSASVEEQYYNPNYTTTTSHSPVAVVTGPPQPPSVAVVTGAPQPPTVIPHVTATGTRRTDGEKCCIITAGVSSLFCCLCCILPFIIFFVIVFTVGPDSFDDDFYNQDATFDDDFFDTTFDDDFFKNND